MGQNRVPPITTISVGVPIINQWLGGTPILTHSHVEVIPGSDLRISVRWVRAFGLFFWGRTWDDRSPVWDDSDTDPLDPLVDVSCSKSKQLITYYFDFLSCLDYFDI